MQKESMGTPPETDQFPTPQPSAQVPRAVEDLPFFENPPILPQWPTPQENGPEPMDWEPLPPTPRVVLEPSTFNRSVWIDRLRMTAGNDRMTLFAQTGYMTAGLARALMVVAAFALPAREATVPDFTNGTAPTLPSKSLVVATVTLEAILALGLLAKVPAPMSSQVS